MDWYYVENGQRMGPVEDAEISQLTSSGKVTGETLVWNPTMTNWQPYREVAPPSMDDIFSTAGSANPFPTGGTSAGGAGGGGAAEFSSAFGSTGQPATGNLIGEAAVGASSVESAVCHECGIFFPKGEMVSFGDKHICANCKNPFFQKMKEGAQVSGPMDYAGFWIRFAAKILDYIVIRIFSFIIMMIMGKLARHGVEWQLFGGFIFTYLILPIIYFPFMHARFGQSLGKMATGLQVVRSDGEKLSYGRALARFLAEIISVMTIYVGFIMAAFDDEKRALHDHICDTRVIKIR